MGRYKDVIIRGGDNVYPDQVEDVIHEIQGVLEVAVVGVPDEFWGEVPRAYIVKDGETTVTEESIIQYCKEKLASYKIPEVVFVGEGGAGPGFLPILQESQVFLGRPGGIPLVTPVFGRLWDHAVRADAGTVSPGDGGVQQGEPLGIVDGHFQRCPQRVHVADENDAGGQTGLGQHIVQFVHDHQIEIAGPCFLTAFTFAMVP